MDTIRRASVDLKDPVYYLSGTPRFVSDVLGMLRDAVTRYDSIKVESFRGYR